MHSRSLFFVKQPGQYSTLSNASGRSPVRPSARLNWSAGTVPHTFVIDTRPTYLPYPSDLSPTTLVLDEYVSISNAGARQVYLLVSHALSAEPY